VCDYNYCGVTIYGTCNFPLYYYYYYYYYYYLTSFSPSFVIIITCTICCPTHCNEPFAVTAPVYLWYVFWIYTCISDSSVGIVTGLWTSRPGRRRRPWCPPKRPDRLWTSVVLIAYRKSVPRSGRGQSVKLNCER